MDDSVIRYEDNDKPLLSCGARVVIETEAEIRGNKVMQEWMSPIRKSILRLYKILQTMLIYSVECIQKRMTRLP